MKSATMGKQKVKGVISVVMFAEVLNAEKKMLELEHCGYRFVVRTQACRGYTEHGLVSRCHLMHTIMFAL